MWLLYGNNGCCGIGALHCQRLLSVGGHAMMYGVGVKQKLCKMACIVKFMVIRAFKNVSITEDTQDDKMFSQQ